MTNYSIMIAEGTKVLSSERGLVTLKGLVVVDAIRERDGGYSYSVAGERFYASGGTVRVIHKGGAA